MNSSGLLFFCSLILYGFASFAQAAGSDQYVLGPQDSLAITVFGVPDLSVSSAQIASDGTISMPLLGNIQVAGLTTMQVSQKLERLLADGYLRHPRVNVSIVAYRQFYVHGEVKKPGGYSYQDGLNVQRAIVLAGGMTERASPSKITLTPASNPSETLSVGLDHPVHPGDVISVGESFF